MNNSENAVMILAGGVGSRLYPISKKDYPKQFLKINSCYSTFQETLLRAYYLVPSENIYISTKKEYVGHVLNQIQEIGKSISESNILTDKTDNIGTLYPIAEFLQDNSKNIKNLLVMPSDHKMNAKSIPIFKREMNRGTGGITIFGKKPEYPNTNYGYILPSNRDLTDMELVDVKNFVEKPSIEGAEQLIENGALWNIGIFLINSTYFDNTFNSYYESIQDIEDGQSFDKGILQKMCGGLYVCPMDCFWDDMGSIMSYERMYYQTTPENGKKTTFLNSQDKQLSAIMQGDKNIYYSDNSQKRMLVSLGLSDVIIIDTKDMLAIVPKNESAMRDLKDLVERHNPDFLENYNFVHRKWGTYEILQESKTKKIKLLSVLPNKALSLQSHNHRAETWYIIAGAGNVLLEDNIGDLEQISLKKGDIIEIPVGRKHKLINDGFVKLEILEVQEGEYLGENDIKRFD